jgi:hypothetical protein
VPAVNGWLDGGDPLVREDVATSQPRTGNTTLLVAAVVEQTWLSQKLGLRFLREFSLSRRIAATKSSAQTIV